MGVFFLCECYAVSDGCRVNVMLLVMGVLSEYMCNVMLFVNMR